MDTIGGDPKLRDIWESACLHRDARGDVAGAEQMVDGCWNDKRKTESRDLSMPDFSDKVPRTRPVQGQLALVFPDFRNTIATPQ